MTETTPRLSLPLLQAGQAQKEIVHNEAIILLDAIVSGLVESVGGNDPPASPIVGQAWIVGAAPSASWAGHAQSIALWTEGGWRFAAPAEGMSFRVRSSGIKTERGAAAWSTGALTATAVVINDEQVVGARLSGITDPAGGITIDTEARTAIAALLVTLRTHGLISS